MIEHSSGLLDDLRVEDLADAFRSAALLLGACLGLTGK